MPRSLTSLQKWSLAKDGNKGTSWESSEILLSDGGMRSRVWISVPSIQFFGAWAPIEPSLGRWQKHESGLGGWLTATVDAIKRWKRHLTYLRFRLNSDRGFFTGGRMPVVRPSTNLRPMRPTF